MKKFFIYLSISLIFSQQLAQSQELKGKKVLIVWGGWEGHNPKLFSNIVENWLIKNSAKVEVENSLDIYSNLDHLMKFDLIIQSVTNGEITPEQEKNLIQAIRNGVGFAGAHGGLIDSFRSNAAYHFMTGGQWVEHPGGMVNFKVKIIKDELTKGIKDFEIFSEQYY
ncbi:ThuA domain-containing protein, partial [Flavobacteriaceae bacterium]|nr:ThuA domain-containing protein [Flavobacteriaceae bacterium]